MPFPNGFEEYTRKILSQKKPHHVIGGMIDLLGWLSDEWEEVSDFLGSSSSQRVLRRISDGQTVEVDIVWREKSRA